MTSDLSTTMLDYLTEIYRLSDRQPDTNAYVSTSALAEMLDVSAPAVNRMVNKLKDLSLLNHEPYQGIQLTERGREEALKHLRRHRIVEAFLVEVMNFKWHEIHEEADRISQALGESSTLIERMAQMSGNPQFCPHGEPIPDEQGHIPLSNDIMLLNAPLKTDLEVCRVRTREPDRLEYLGALGLVPGAKLQMLNIAPFNGPIQLRLGKEYRIIGHNLAETIFVRPAE